MSDKDVKPSHHYGRGGAGNITAKPTGSPALEPQLSTPVLKSKNYTTGRGGTGNMAKNDDPVEARIAQDVEVPGISLAEGTHHTGRGGAANVYTPNEVEKQEAQKHNQKLRSESFKAQDRSTLKGIADKAKDLLSSK